MNLIELANTALQRCAKGTPALAARDCEPLLQYLPLWRVLEGDSGLLLERSWRFKNFAEALAFTNRVGTLAEEADHHPAILLEWGQVRVQWWTHTVGGLHLNDFVMAARCELATQQASESP